MNTFKKTKHSLHDKSTLGHASNANPNQPILNEKLKDGIDNTRTVERLESSESLMIG